MTIRFIGVDPGKTGAIAAIDSYDNVLFIKDLSSEYQTYWEIIADAEDWAGSYEDSLSMVEDVCGRPGQSCQSNTTFMKLAGMAELATYTISDMSKVKPQVWKKHFGLISKGLTKTEKKKMSIELAKKLFPSVADQLTASKDGRAEALLLAKYCKDMYDDKI